MSELRRTAVLLMLLLVVAGASANARAANAGAAEAAAKAREAGEKVWAGAKKQVNTVAEEIEERPLTAAAAAFGLGVVVGLLFSRRG